MPERAPMDCDIVTSAPTLLMNERALHSHVKNPATPTAATLSLPSCPSQIMSVMLYAIWTKEAVIKGIAILHIPLLMLPRVKSFVLVMLLFFGLAKI